MIMCVANLINQFPSILSLAPTLHPPQASGWSQHHHHSHRKEPRDHHCRSPPGCSIIEKITCAHCSAPSACSPPPLSPLPWSTWSVRWGWSSRSSTGRWRRSSSAGASPTRPLVLLASYSSPPDDDVYIMMMGLLTMIVMVAVLIVDKNVVGDFLAPRHFPFLRQSQGQEAPEKKIIRSKERILKLRWERKVMTHIY